MLQHSHGLGAAKMSLSGIVIGVVGIAAILLHTYCRWLEQIVISKRRSPAEEPSFVGTLTPASAHPL
jgi:hypothetical protein